jgi:hypothetical protein
MEKGALPPPADGARGWQPDPLNPSQLRYWGGEAWTRKTRRAPTGNVGVKPMHIWPVLLGALAVLVLFLWHPALGFGALILLLLLAALFWIIRPGSRPCPRCGQRVKNGVLDCPHCGFDFRTIG